jgi:hypothetical protein
MVIAMAKRKREFNIDHREMILAEAERQLREQGVAYEKVTYVCPSRDGVDWDALVYVWGDFDGAVARAYGVKMPDDAQTDEPAPSPDLPC